MTRSLDIVLLGLSLSSSWGNGHATTYRALIKGLRQDGHRVLFVERDVPWYASHRDLPSPDFCELAYYSDIGAMVERHGERLRRADAVIVGSYVPHGVQLIDRLEALEPKRLCFYDIDTPVTLAKLDRADQEYLALRQIPLFDAYFSFSGGEVLTRLEQRYGARRAIALYCSVDESRYVRTGESHRWDFGYLGTYSPDRQPTLERLLLEPARRLPSMRFVVAGPQYPAEIEWPANVERIEHLPPADHASFYSRQRFTLNVTRGDMIAAGWSPSVRLFEAAACGAPIVSDFWQGLDELLPDGKALFIARAPEDVVALLTELPDSDRLAVAAAARKLVMSSHTGAARAGELVRALSDLPAKPAFDRISA
ncbi:MULTISPECIES: CgeB family protein [unclassified Rhizobium]|uniref:CgeB family protein n=1 Tax=unclassified Rhizobium TaxID=2613769 RepID=UPI0007EB893A|nr:MULTISPECIES: glycosyltransferase [unclassified Rhizobium]ANK87836.1 glycosyltransferase domain-containing protein [Rhizobium sp. N731]ANL18082.1 glycosyltransferase domain-containing protein [Rhizobium sp. N1314]